MTPRTIAALFVFSFSALAAAPQAAPDFRPATVGVMLSFERKPSPDWARRLRREVEEIFGPSKLDLRWEVLNDHTQPGSYSRAVVVEVRGRCGFTRVAEVEPAWNGTVQLGWTLVNDGEVIPHAAIDCDRIAAVVAGARKLALNRQLLPGMYQTLSARVLAHELMHALLRTADHQQSGCLRTPLRLADLQAPVRLSSTEVAALREVGRPSGVVMAGAK